MNTYPKATFEKTVDILVKAYLNDTLEHGNCTACAVGNIIAESEGTQPRKLKSFGMGEFYSWENKVRPEWINVFCTPTARSSQKINESSLFGEAKRQIDVTGYSYLELAKIEFAFERGNTLGYIQIDDTPEKEQAMFNGLMAVVDVLAEIHGISLEAREESKKLFVKA